MQEALVETVLARLETSFDPARDAVDRRGGAGFRGVAPRRPRDRGLARRAARRAAGAAPLQGGRRRRGQRAFVRPDAPVRARRAGRRPLHEGVRRARRRARAHAPRGLLGGVPRGPARGLRRGARRGGVGVRARGRHRDRGAGGGRRPRAGARALRAARPGESEAAASPARADVGRPRQGRRRGRAARLVRVRGPPPRRGRLERSRRCLRPTRARARWDVSANLSIDSFTGRPGLTVVDLAPEPA